MRFKQIFINIVEKQGTGSIKYVQPVEVATATGGLAKVFGQMRRDFGSVLPLVLLHSPAPALFYGVWAVLRETLLVGNVPRGFKEVVSGAVSKINECPFCVDAHTILLHKPAARLALLVALASYQVDEGVIKAFRSQYPGDDKLIGAAAWASFMAARRIGSWLQEAEAQLGMENQVRLLRPSCV
jgi:AhpD family alkylhydroperoxidase